MPILKIARISKSPRNAVRTIESVKNICPLSSLILTSSSIVWSHVRSDFEVADEPQLIVGAQLQVGWLDAILRFFFSIYIVSWFYWKCGSKVRSRSFLYWSWVFASGRDDSSTNIMSSCQFFIRSNYCNKNNEWFRCFLLILYKYSKLETIQICWSADHGRSLRQILRQSLISKGFHEHLFNDLEKSRTQRWKFGAKNFQRMNFTSRPRSKHTVVWKIRRSISSFWRTFWNMESLSRDWDYLPIMNFLHTNQL